MLLLRAWPLVLEVENGFICSHICLNWAYTGLHERQSYARMGTCSDCNRWALPLGVYGHQVLRDEVFGPWQVLTDTRMMSHMPCFSDSGHLRLSEPGPFSPHRWERLGYCCLCAGEEVALPRSCEPALL